MKIRGKKGRTVPVLLKPGITKCIELLLQYRTTAKVSNKNEYLFALPSPDENQKKVINAGILFVKFSKLCGAHNPDSLRGTNMRKHIASMCIGMNLSDTVIGEVAQFMGHHEKIHREYYRHNTIDREVVQMSQLLKVAQGHVDEKMNDSCNESDDDNDDEIIGENDNNDEFYLMPNDGEEAEIQPEVSNNTDIPDIKKCITPEFHPSIAPRNLKRKMANESEDEVMDEQIPKKLCSRKRWTPDEKKSCNNSVFYSLPNENTSVKRRDIKTARIGTFQGSTKPNMASNQNMDPKSF